MSTKHWEAVVRVNMPAGGQAWNSNTNRYETATYARDTAITVPDAGGYFNTKALLEGSYGQGSVMRLSEKY